MDPLVLLWHQRGPWLYLRQQLFQDSGISSEHLTALLIIKRTGKRNKMMFISTSEPKRYIS
jgi:hypothetical protein